MQGDVELLEKFVEHASEEAFREVVLRHAGMVLGTAQRLAPDRQTAEDITQAVFVLLSRKAAKLITRTKTASVAGWLHRATHFVAREARRAAHRRERCLQEFASMNPSSNDPPSHYLSAHLADALITLKNADREALVLRFLEDKTFGELAAAFGTSEPAARMRVSRALQNLRAKFQRRGITATDDMLETALAAETAGPLQPAFSAMIATCALSQGAQSSAVSSLVRGSLKLMFAENLKLAGSFLAVILCFGAGSLFLFGPESADPAGHLKTLAPLAGNWEGTYQFAGVISPARLKVSATDEGRRCDIEMEITTQPGQTNVYHFSHHLNEARNRILTMDDPRISRASGEGVVIPVADRPEQSYWRSGFRSDSHDHGSECTWTIDRDRLQIERIDRVPGPGGIQALRTTLNLRRVP